MSSLKPILIVSHDVDFYNKLSSIAKPQFVSVFDTIGIHDLTCTRIMDSSFLIVNATVNPFGVIKCLQTLMSDIATVDITSARIPVIVFVEDDFIKNTDMLDTSFYNMKILTQSKMNPGFADYLNSIFTVMSLDVNMANFYSEGQQRNAFNNNNNMYDYHNSSSNKFVIKLDHKTCRVFVNSTPISFCAINFRILELLISRKNEVITREEFIKYVWKDNPSVSPRTVDVHIKRIRDKLLPNVSYKRSPLKTVRNIGYYYVSYEDLNNDAQDSSSDYININSSRSADKSSSTTTR